MLRIGNKELVHYLLVVPSLPYQADIVTDVLVGLSKKLHTVNNVQWSLAIVPPNALWT